MDGEGNWISDAGTNGGARRKIHSQHLEATRAAARNDSRLAPRLMWPTCQRLNSTVHLYNGERVVYRLHRKPTPSRSAAPSTPLRFEAPWRGADAGDRMRLLLSGRGRIPPPPSGRLRKIVPLTPRRLGIRLPAPMASTVDSPGNSSDFAKRMDRAWLISKQPRPSSCSSCQSTGDVECKWCAGTGFFILGNNMLCEVPLKNTTCVICSGKDRRGEMLSRQCGGWWLDR